MRRSEETGGGVQICDAESTLIQPSRIFSRLSSGVRLEIVGDPSNWSLSLGSLGTRSGLLYSSLPSFFDNDEDDFYQIIIHKRRFTQHGLNNSPTERRFAAASRT